MKKILAVLSNRGFWGIEFAAPYNKLVAAGYQIDIITPKGEKPVALPPSYDTDFYDPPLGKHVTTESDAGMVKEIIATDILDNPMNLNSLIPERPYYSRENFLRELENYYNSIKEAENQLSEYSGVMLVGGSGPIIDMVNNQRLHEVILAFYRAEKPIAAICYGVACLAMARDFNERKPIIKNKHVTGHCIEYDYHDGTGFAGTDFNMGPPPYCLEYLLSDAVQPDGQYHGNFGKETSVIVDYPFITARSLQCSHEFGEQFVNVLEKGLKKYGWK